MSTGLYMPDGSFKAFNAVSLTSEIATRQNAGGLFDGTFAGFLNLLPDPDPVLRKRGDDASILDDLAADDHVTAAILGRKERVLKRDDYTISPGANEGEEATAMAELLSSRLTADLERTTLHDIVAQILDAPFYGMVPLEIMWEPDGNWWHIKDIIPRPSHWFAYNQDNQLVFKGENSFNAEVLPSGKFVVARHHPTFKNPYGLRLLSRCLWPVAFKRGGIEFYVRFVEKFGVPHTVVKAPARAQASEKQKIANDAARMVADAVVVLPHGSEVSFETVSGTTGDIHEKFLSRWDKAISKVVSGQTLTLEMEGSNSLAASETHADVADDISHADSRIVTTVMNEICWLYARINAGEQELCPVFSYKDVEDLHGRADLDGKLYALGVRFTKQHFTTVYKLTEEEFELSPAGQPEQTSADSLSFSAPSDPSKQAGHSHLAEKAQLKLDEIIAEMLPELVEANQNFITELENAISKSENWEELEFMLSSFLQDRTEPDQLEEIMHRAMTAAGAYGAAAVKAEEKEDA